MTDNYLGSRGYVVYKSNLSEQELLELKQELTVVPFTAEGYGQPAESFKNYQESSSKLYLPRYYALQKFGVPKINKLQDGLDINIDFKGSLRPIQIDAIKSVLDCCNDPKKMGALLCLACGFGKCLGYDTDIIMFDGSIKKVQDIKLGDKIMGDDSKSRTILSIARGREMMYEIIPTKGNSYKVNESHILSLKCSTNKNKNLKKGDIVDISVNDYLNLPSYYHGKAGPLLGYRVPIEFPTTNIDFDPYMIGYWLGNGAKRRPEISCQDSTVLHYFAKTLPKKYNSSLTYVSQYDYYISGARRKGDQHSINPFLTALQNNNLINNKHIPMIYKCNSREVRLSVLAGLLDSDGSYDGFCFDIGLTNEKLFDDLLFLARSLGFACYKTQKKTSWTYKGIKKYGVCFRTYISGEGLETIPTKIPRKRASSRKKIKNVLVTRIKVKKLQVDNYYGFEIDGNHRFVLGDFTVTHNTVCAISMICTLAKKTLIIVHKEFLLEQWKERIREFAPSARLGLIKAKVIDVENKDIVLASLQSLSMKDYDEGVFKDFGNVVLDECFPYSQSIVTEKGPISIGRLYNMWKNKESLPLIKSFNIDKKIFEWKTMTYAWEKQADELLDIKFSKNRIKCTPNHKILTPHGMIEVEKLKIGDLVIANYDNEITENSCARALNDDQYQVLLGSILGDGCISTLPSNRYILRIAHGLLQKDYCDWKANMFGETTKIIDNNGYSQTKAVIFNTKIIDLENEIPKEKNIIPKWIIDDIDERGIAIWYMDDGSLSKEDYSTSLHTNTFNIETHEMFVEKFKTYNIECTIHESKKKYYYLKFNTINTLKLFNLIGKYIHSSMKYKIINDILPNEISIYIWNETLYEYGTMKISSITRIDKWKDGHGLKNTKNVYDIEVADNHNFICCGQTSLSGICTANCHHLAAEVFSKALKKVNFKYAIGLTATPKRKDGLTKVFKWYLGDIAYESKKVKDSVEIRFHRYYNMAPEYSRIHTLYNKKPNIARMINNICEFIPRVTFIEEIILNILKDEPNRRFLILSDRRQHVHLIKDALDKHKLESGFYYGGMKPEDLKKSESKHFIIGTFQNCQEGMDIKGLDTLILASPKGDVIQICGRILRDKPEDRKHMPLIIDVVDDFGSFTNQAKKRHTYYKKCKYEIIDKDNTLVAQKKTVNLPKNVCVIKD